MFLPLSTCLSPELKASRGVLIWSLASAKCVCFSVATAPLCSLQQRSESPQKWGITPIHQPGVALHPGLTLPSRLAGAQAAHLLGVPLTALRQIHVALQHVDPGPVRRHLRRVQLELGLPQPVLAKKWPWNSEGSLSGLAENRPNLPFAAIVFTKPKNSRSGISNTDIFKGENLENPEPWVLCSWCASTPWRKWKAWWLALLSRGEQPCLGPTLLLRKVPVVRLH